MQVALLNQYYAPDEAATAQVLSDVGVALVQAGHDVRSICGDRSYADLGRRYPKRDMIDGVQVERLGTTAFGRYSRLGRSIDYMTFYLRAAARLVLGPRPEVVVALTTPPFIALAAVIAGKLRRFSVVFWSMDVYPDVAVALGALRRDSFLAAALCRMARVLHRSADAVVVLGETMANRLRDDGAMRVVVIHNWADLRLEAALTGEAGFRQHRGAEPGCDEFVVMYSGNIGMAHEFETVLEAAQLFSEGRFLFVGAGPRRDQVERRARKLELSNIEFRSYVPREQLAESLTSADVHLVTLRESMPGLLVPSKIYGILAAGKPTLYIGPAQGEIHDIITSGHCGVSIRIGDVAGAVGALRRYRDDPRLRERHGRAARRMYDERFARCHSIGRFVRVVEDVARSGR